MFKKITKFLAGSILAQGLNSVTGLLLAQWLPINHYAILTVMNMIISSMTILTKGGINLGFTAIIGRTWPDRTRASEALNAAIKERKIVSYIMIPPILGVAAWMLFQNNVEYSIIFGLLLLLLLQWHFDVQTRIVDQVLVFANKAIKLQGLDTTLACIKILCVTIAFFYDALSSFLVVLIYVLVSGLRVPFIKRWTKHELGIESSNISINDRLEIRNITKRQLPIEVFYVFQSQIALLITAWYSATEATASIGALWRIGQLLLPIQSVFNTFAIPHYSRIKNNILKTWFFLSITSSIPGLCLILVSYFFPDMLLLLIGPNYSNLHDEILITAIGTTAYSTFGASLQLLAHRGWNRLAWVQIPTVLVWCIVAPLILNLQNLAQILWFHAGLSLGLLSATIAEVIFIKVRRTSTNQI